MSEGSEVVRKPDAFDVIEIKARDITPGQRSDEEIIVPQNQDVLQRIIENPAALLGTLDLTESQAENIASVIAGSGAGLGYKYLNKIFGSEISAMIGAGIGAYIARKMTGRER